MITSMNAWRRIGPSLLRAAAHPSLAAMRLRGVHQLRMRCRQTRSLVLTFDDGPGASLTPQLLDLLRSRGVHATFFAVGRRATAAPALMAQIRREGHEVGCHSATHLHALRVDRRDALRDVEDGFALLAPWMDASAPYRPPYGKMTSEIARYLRSRHSPLAWWTAESGDIEDELPSPDHALAQVRRDGGGVVLMHDFDQSQQRAEFVLKSVTILLDGAEREGWTVRTLRALQDVSLDAG